MPASRSLPKRLWYAFLHVTCRLLAVVVFRVRVEGREHVPSTGGVLVLSNHQSHLDPVLIGLACDRRINYLARETLFGFAPFRWLIYSLDAIPIDREGLGLAGVKETLRRLKQGEMVLIFPEGTRTRDGQIATLKPGFALLARRTSVPLVPVAIEGAYDAWPRRRLLPASATIHIRFGEPLLPEHASTFDDREIVTEIERRIRVCHALVARQRSLTEGARPTKHEGAGVT
ncbi:MAG TPA: lysophospholipid acyltransferase family protein [Pirellulales bacterium]|jgi:1-acyl-sn-glycerol-3-phosphate acyltransferase|nr:lysophospholipid acyltransferase family protein [Pirellulales bacterium]